MNTEKVAAPQSMPPFKTKRQMKIEKAKSCSESGKTKGGSCTCDQIDKGFSFHNRSHKLKKYCEWNEKMLAKYEKYK